MTTTSRVRANRGDGAKLREEILVAAEQLLVESGGDAGITLRGVAQLVGVTTPSVYRHFPDKAAMVGAVCLRVWDELTERMETAATEHDDPFVALGASGLAYVEFGLKHPVQYRLLLMRPAIARSDGRPSEQDAAALICFRSAVRASSRCVAADVFAGDAELIARTLWVTVHGIVSMLISSPPFPDAPDVARFVEFTMRSVGLGVALTSRLPADATAGDVTALVCGIAASAGPASRP